MTVAAAIAAVALSLTGALPAAAEVRNFPGVNCQGSGYTTAKTTAFWDYSSIGSYPSGSPADTASFGPNTSRAIQVHNNWTNYHRTSNAVIWTDINTDWYMSAAHLCDN
jgi:hypothetical protein